MLPRHRKASARSPRDHALGSLIAKTALGERSAFALLYEATHHEVYAYVLSIVCDPAQSEEVTQDTYLRIWQERRSYDPARGSAGRWIHLLARRCSIDRIRKAEAFKRQDTLHFWSNQSVEYDETIGTVHDLGEIADVRAALASLTELQLEALRLVYFDSQTHQQAADRLDIPIGTAKSRIRDGVHRLRLTLAANEDERPEGVG